MDEPEKLPPPPAWLGVIEDIDTFGLKATVFKTAMELDVFTTIASGCQHLEEIARATRCSLRGMRVLLDALCPLGLLTNSASSYALTPPARAFLVRTEPTCCMDIYLALFQGRERFTDCVRTGKPALDLSGPEAEVLWASYTAQFLVRWPWFAEIVRKRWETSGVTARAVSCAHILDVGSGAGIKSFVLAQADPTIRVLAVDTPKVLAVAARVAGAMGVAGQVSYQPGDVLHVDLGCEQFDIVLLGNVLRFFAANHIRDILHKVHHALKSSGLVVVDDDVLDEERPQTEQVLLTAVFLVNSAPYGDFHTLSHYRELLEGAGFTQVTLHGERPLTARKGRQ